MVITDIKDAKIRVENEAHSKSIQETAFDMGYAWDDGNSTFFGNCSFIFFDNSLEITQCGNEGYFYRDKAKEIFFYNGEFHDKPQDEQCGEVEWKNGDECVYKHIKDVTYAYVGAHPSKQGHFVFNEEQGITYVHNDYLEKPISKEEIEKQEKVKKLTSVLWGSDLGVGSFDAKVLAEKLINLGVEYRKGEL